MLWDSFKTQKYWYLMIFSCKTLDLSGLTRGDVKKVVFLAERFVKGGGGQHQTSELLPKKYHFLLLVSIDSATFCDKESISIILNWFPGLK